MRLFRPIMVGPLALLIVGAATPAAPAPSSERVLYMDATLAHAAQIVADAAEQSGGPIVVSGKEILTGPYIKASINGVPMRLLVDFNAPGTAVLLNSAAAEQAKLRATWEVGAELCLPKPIFAKGTNVRVEIGARKENRPVAWIDDVDFADGGADGRISPNALPEERLTMRFHAPVAGERAVSIPLNPGKFTTLNTWLRVGKRRILLSYALHQPYNIATGAAGSYLASSYDGHWAGAPRTIKLDWEGERPARPIKLRRPPALSGLRLDSLLVRTADYRGQYQLPGEDDVDPNEIVVTRRPTKGCASLELTLGQETFRGCSSVSFDQKREKMTAQCL